MSDKPTTSERFEMRLPRDWMARVDEWRRVQPDLPSRAEAIRRLVDLTLAPKRRERAKP